VTYDFTFPGAESSIGDYTTSAVVADDFVMTFATNSMLTKAVMDTVVSVTVTPTFEDTALTST
jgi:hypothetical protein